MIVSVIVLGAAASLAYGAANTGTTPNITSNTTPITTRNASVDLMVRFREPQNTRSAAAVSALRNGVGLKADVQLVNAEEGVIRVRFANWDEAKRARDRLQGSSHVVNIAPNLLYRPAMNYQIKPVTPMKPGTSFLAFPFSRFVETAEDREERTIQTVIPDVLVPPFPSVKSGLDPLSARDWALKAIRYDKISDAEKGVSKVLTAVIDTGMDYNHEDLLGAMWRKPGKESEVGYDFAHDHAKPYDQVLFDVEGCLKNFLCRIGMNQEQFLVNPGHGTHCAGHVAAVYNNSIGMQGIGAGSKIIALKFFYDAGEANAGQGDDAAAIRSIDYAIKNGVKVISASWGQRVPRDEAEKSELKQALIRAQKAGVLVVIAAGNDGVDLDTVEDPTFPAAYELDNIIVVAASDSQDQLAGFSCYGKKTAHLAAPGVKILSTTAGGKYSDVIARFKDEGGKEHQVDWDGTSMATPIVAGAAALVWSKYPEASYHEIRDRILKTVRHVPGLESKVSTGGILDVAAALR